MNRTIEILDNPLRLVFVCPLTNRYIIDPVRINGSGHLYEREAIESHILRFGTKPQDSSETASVDDLIRDEPLFFVIKKTLEECSGKGNIPSHFLCDSVQKYLKVLLWFRNPTQTYFDVEGDLLQRRGVENDSEDEEIYGLEEEEEEEEEDDDDDDDDDDEEEEEEEEGGRGRLVIPRFARFPPFLRRSKSDLCSFLGRMGPLQRNVLHFAVIYLRPEHLRFFCEEFETLLWNEGKAVRSKKFSDIGKKNRCRKKNTQPKDIIGFLLQKDGMNCTPLEYSILYGRGMDSFEKFIVVSSFFKAEKKRMRNQFYSSRNNGEQIDFLKSSPGRTTPYPFPLSMGGRKRKGKSPSLPRRRPALSCPPFEPSLLQKDHSDGSSSTTSDKNSSSTNGSPSGSHQRSTVIISKRMSFLDPCCSCFFKVQESERMDRFSKVRYQSCAATFAKLGDRDCMLLLFRLGVRPNDKFETLFHLEVAAGFENVDMLEFILSYGQYLQREGVLKEEDMKNACDDAFTASAANGLIEPAKALIRYGVVDVNQKCKNFRRFCSFSLSAASFYGHVDFVLFLLSLHESKKVKLDLDQVFLGSCALNAACSTTDPEKEIVKLLLDHGCKPNPDLSKVCESPLMISAKRNHISLMKMLITSGARINDQSVNKRNTALHLAVVYQNYEAMKLLIKHYASLDILNFDGKTSRDLIRGDKTMQRFVDRVIQKRARRERMRRKRGGEIGDGIPQQIQSLKEIIFSQQKKIEKQKNQIQGFKKMISNFVSDK